MAKLLLSLLFTFVAVSVAAPATSLPQAAPKSLTIGYIQEVGNCTYRVNITTSCSSPVHTSAEIGILFGDANGNQIYEPKLKPENSKTFGKCSKDSFELEGPCTDQICYLYLYRNGSEDWIAESVEISSSEIKTVEFKFKNSSIPANTWYGFDECQYVVPPPPPPPALPPPSASTCLQSEKWFVSVILVLLNGALL